MAKSVEITEDERKLFGELLWDALATTAPEQWSDHEATVATFCKVALTHTLQNRRGDLKYAYQPDRDGFELDAINAELKRRAE